MQSYMHMCCQARAQLRLEKNGEIELIQDPISSERGLEHGVNMDGGHELDVLEVHSEDVELGLVCAQAVGQDAAPGSAPSLRGVARLRVLQQ